MSMLRHDADSASPFAVALAPFVDVLPPAFREQFLLPADASWHVLLDGRMEAIWHQPRWLRPILRIFARWAVLYPETGRHVPTRMVIAPGRDRHGRPAHVWRRTFSFPTERRIDADMAYEPQLDQIVEWMGPRNSLEMAWRPTFVPPRSLEIRAELQALRLGPFRLPLPSLLRVRARALDTAGPGDDTIRCDLVVSHPLLGPIFGYAGTFRVLRVDPSCER